MVVKVCSWADQQQQLPVNGKNACLFSAIPSISERWARSHVPAFSTLKRKHTLQFSSHITFLFHRKPMAKLWKYQRFFNKKTFSIKNLLTNLFSKRSGEIRKLVQVSLKPTAKLFSTLSIVSFGQVMVDILKYHNDSFVI